MRKIIRFTESDLHKIVSESVHKVLNESISGKYQVYVDGDPKNVLIDTKEPSIQIDDYIINGKEAKYGIQQILGFLQYNQNGLEDAIEQYLYDILR